MSPCLLLWTYSFASLYTYFGAITCNKLNFVMEYLENIWLIELCWWKFGMWEKIKETYVVLWPIIMVVRLTSLFWIEFSICLCCYLIHFAVIVFFIINSLKCLSYCNCWILHNYSLCQWMNKIFIKDNIVTYTKPFLVSTI
jgi:hypothetical protein